MSLSIEQLVMHFKHDVGRAFDPAAILALCGSVGHVWRTRQLDPVVTLQAFVLQVLHGNTACSHVPRLLGIDVTAEAYGQARSRLPLEFFQRLLEEVCSRLRGSIDTASSWHGHRVWVIDGSSCSMLDTPELQQAFGQPSGQAPGCGFPVALYAKRWEVETDLRHLKHTLGMDVLRTKSLDGIHKELAMFAIVYNLVRLAMLEAAQRGRSIRSASASWMLSAGCVALAREAPRCDRLASCPSGREGTTRERKNDGPRTTG